MIDLKLTSFERSVLQLFFNLCPQWERIISKQIRHSSLRRERSLSNYSIYFKNDAKTDRLNIATKMPVEIILGKVDIPTQCVIHHINGCPVISPCILSVLDRDAISARIYFSEGFLMELEIYSISGKKLIETIVPQKQCTFIVHDSSIGLINAEQNFS